MQPATTASDRITELAGIISANTAVVSEYLSSHHLASLSNDEDAPSKPQIPAHEVQVIEAQDAVVAATQELGLLMKGPTEGLLGMSVRLSLSSDKILLSCKRDGIVWEGAATEEETSQPADSQ